MIEYLLYIIKSTVYLSVFYVFFMLVMRKTTFFRFNRIVFLFSTALCLVLPLLHLSLPQMSVMPMNTIEEALAPSVVSNGELYEMQEQNVLLMAISAVYHIGTIVVLVGLSLSFIRMRLHMDKIPTQIIDGIKIKLSDVDMPSFSWGNVVVISRNDFEENPTILTHEMMHIKSLHSVDLAAYAIIMVIHWFNPLVWVARRELKMLHEYEVDNLTVNTGVDSSQYQLLLIKKAVGEKRFQMANGFNHSKVKSRIDMMHRARTNKWGRCAYVLCIPMLGAAMCCCNQNSLVERDIRYDGVSITIASDSKNISLVDFTSSEMMSAFEAIGGPISDMTVEIKLSSYTSEDLKYTLKEELRNLSLLQLTLSNDDTDAIPYNQIYKKPMFDGGDATKFSRWVNTNLNYPAKCIEERIQGRVTIQFTVNEVGEVTDVKVLNGVCKELDEEAMRVVKESPVWEPGRTKDGLAVPVTFTFPVIFMLREP